MLRIGVICPSEIAIRRFLPALQECDGAVFAGMGVSTPDERRAVSPRVDENNQAACDKDRAKTEDVISHYGGKAYDSYKAIATAEDIDALYIPLPPAMHHEWARIALEHGKHVIVEKPSTTSLQQSRELVSIARTAGLALHENYMFTYHNQLDALDAIINSGELGQVRLYRISFGFPRRPEGDFRYSKALGGGALLDAGGYTLRYALRLLGKTASIQCAHSNYVEGFEVDIYGSATLMNDEGVTAQIAFGMDNDYKCELEVWGSKGCLRTGRVLTAPVGFIPEAVIRKGQIESMIELPSDDSFKKSISHFLYCIDDGNLREANYSAILRQAELVEEFKHMAEKC